MTAPSIEPDRPAPQPRVDDSGPEFLSALSRRSGIRRVHVVAWRDLDDVEAGGSELHAHEVLRRWAEAGIDVSMRTSHAQGHPSVVRRDGYRVRRKAGRYLVFPRAAGSVLRGREGRIDALVEIWNGMPFLSPVWFRGPRLTFLHHLHDTMWDLVLPPRLARLGRTLEAVVAPPLYRGGHVVTLSESSREAITAGTRLRASDVAVVEPGVSTRFCPGGTLASEPTVLAVGRLMPAKRLDRLIHAAALARAEVPGMRLVIVGEGYERGALEAVADQVDGDRWITFAGRVDDDELLAHYRSAWVLAAASSHEGWGMTVTEAAACRTPSVATDIAGHRDAIDHGTSGLLVASPEDLTQAMVQILGDPDLRERLATGALERARRLTWDRTAARLFTLLADQVAHRP